MLARKRVVTVFRSTLGIVSSSTLDLESFGYLVLFTLGLIAGLMAGRR
jgi:hypothetical protein